MTEFLMLETSRLRLRHFKASDLELFLAYRNDPEVARYQSWETTSEEEARTFIEEQKLQQIGQPGAWLIAIELKASGELMGDCGVKISEHDKRQAEIGYTLARSYQKQGIAFEAVTCVLDYLFLTLELHRVIASVDCENKASVRLLERTGWRREGHFLQNIWFKGKWGDEYLYALLRDEWQEKHNRVGRDARL